MTDPELTGPDFLDSVADAEAANGNDINASHYRSRSQAWQRDLDRIDELERANANLQNQLDCVRHALAA